MHEAVLAKMKNNWRISFGVTFLANFHSSSVKTIVRSENIAGKMLKSNHL
jgi:hypothetical protein